MAFPVVGRNLGSGIDQMKSIIVGWIRDEIRASQRGGIGLPVDGTLGTLGNNGLTSPVTAGVGGASATNFAVSATSTAVVSVAIAIPDGFTQALVHVTVAASALNGNVAADFLYVRAAITLPGGATTDGSELYGVAVSGSYGTAGASLATVFTGLVPGSITVSCKVRAFANWVATNTNLANVDASIVFLR
jgi:hypothetical protein